MLTLRVNVLSKNYKWKTSYIMFTGVVLGKFYHIKIPYWLWRSNLSDDSIKHLNKIVTKLNRE